MLHAPVRKIGGEDCGGRKDISQVNDLLAFARLGIIGAIGFGELAVFADSGGGSYGATHAAVIAGHLADLDKHLQVFAADRGDPIAA